MDRIAAALHVLFGAVVTVVLSSIPFSPALGGTVAGYLQGPDTGEGLLVGAATGAIAMVPSLAIYGVVMVVLMAFLGLGDPLVSGSFGILLVLFLLATMLYTVGLGAVGGLAGAYLASSYPDQRRRVREVIPYAYEQRTDTGGSLPVGERPG